MKTIGLSKFNLLPAVCAAGLTLYGALAMADDHKEPWQLAQETEVWEPVPDKVDVGENGVPSDAVVLFDGSSLDKWESVEGGPAEWTVADGVLTIKPGKGDIRTRDDFCSVQLHIEWRSPVEPEREGQDKGNSGVFFQERYEVQVLNSHTNTTYPNGQASAVYKQHIPLVNASAPEDTWQTYDIVFISPRFDKSGDVTRPGRLTVFHNGVLVQYHVEIKGATAWIGEPEYDKHGCAPLRLQDHSNPVSFRNIWLRELSDL